MKCHQTFIANEKMANKLFAFYSKSHKRTAHLKVITNYKYINSFTACIVLQSLINDNNTPLQSHLHRPDIDLRFLTCEPNLTAAAAEKSATQKDSKSEHYQDEADVFYAAPEKWLGMEYRVV